MRGIVKGKERLKWEFNTTIECELTISWINLTITKIYFQFPWSSFKEEENIVFIRQERRLFLQIVSNSMQKNKIIHDDQ